MPATVICNPQQHTLSKFRDDTVKFLPGEHRKIIEVMMLIKLPEKVLSFSEVSLFKSP